MKLTKIIRPLIAIIIFEWCCVSVRLAFANDGQGASFSNLATRALITVQVQSVDGKPLPNETVVCVGSKTNAILKGAMIAGGSERLKTDAKGQFTLPLNGTNVALVVANEDGFCLAQSYEVTNHPTMVVQPWGRIEGVRLNRGRPLSGRIISFRLNWRCIGEEIEDRIWTRNQTVTDSQGRFVFEHVPPTAIILQETDNASEIVWSPLDFMALKPRETNRVEIATQGRRIVGQLVLGSGLDGNIVDLKSCRGGLMPDVDNSKLRLPTLPEGIDSSEKRTKFWQDWYKSDAGRERLRVFSGMKDVAFRSDGTFLVERIPPDKYRLNGQIEQDGKRVAMIEELHLVIPKAESDAEDAPFDIGKVVLKAAVNLKAGDVAPDFNAKTLDGKPLKLSDFHGKYVLLDFWATWCGPCVAEMPNLKAIHGAFGKDKRFVMISLSLDPDTDAPRKFVRAKGIQWMQVFLGEWSKDTVTQDYGVYGIPSIFLIGPDGKI